MCDIAGRIAKRADGTFCNTAAASPPASRPGCYPVSGGLGLPAGELLDLCGHEMRREMLGDIS
jgi:hypothetical protein